MAELVWTNVSANLGATRALSGVSLTLGKGSLVALLGANGAGKTTLVRTGLGLAPCVDGSVRLGGEDPRRMAPAERARLVAYLPQSRSVAWALNVRDVVALGRFAYGAPLSRLTGRDAQAVDAAIAACRLETLADRRIETLSGGEQTRVHVARALASQAPMILADEPVAMLDPLHTFETVSIFKKFCADGGGALVSMHDLNLAARFADQVVLLHQGRVLAAGTPETVLTSAHLKQAFGVTVEARGDLLVTTGPA